MLNQEKFKSTPRGFNSPTALPSNEEDQKSWQISNKEWWENNPMRYDFSEQLDIEEGTQDFYTEIDKRFFKSASEYILFRKIPFDSLIPFQELSQKTVLEIGVGNGSHAQLLSIHSKEFNGIDLTEYAVESTRKRFEINNLNGNIQQMNAEELSFPDNYFDFVWSWGVIHHSSSTKSIIKEIGRVLKPGGSVTVMVYHRGFYYYLSALLIWLGKGYFVKGKSLHQAIQDQTDGAIARYYRPSELQKLFENEGLRVQSIRIAGQKSDILPIPGSKIKWMVLNMIPNALGRFFTNTLGWGLMLILSAKKV